MWTNGLGEQHGFRMLLLPDPCLLILSRVKGEHISFTLAVLQWE